MKRETATYHVTVTASVEVDVGKLKSAGLSDAKIKDYVANNWKPENVFETQVKLFETRNPKKPRKGIGSY